MAKISFIDQSTNLVNCYFIYNLFFKFSDAYLIDPNDLIEFEKLPLKNKVIFVSKKYDGLANSIHLKEFEKNGFVGDAFKYRWIYRKYFDAVKWLNNGK